MNRSISIGTVWLTAVFVWRIRILEQELQWQIAIADSHASESALLSSIVAFGDEAIIMNLDGVITSWNRGAERMFGYLAEEVICKPITILIPTSAAMRRASFSSTYVAATPSTIMKRSAEARTET